MVRVREKKMIHGCTIKRRRCGGTSQYHNKYCDSAKEVANYVGVKCVCTGGRN